MKTATTLLAALALAAGLALPAQAQSGTGVWNVGDGFEVRYAGLDLDRAEGRQVLLAQFDRAAAKVCRGERIRSRREACRTQIIQSALSQAASQVQEAVQTARLERDGMRQAMR
jgi:UrcA family protein